MELAVHRGFSPRAGSVEEVFSQLHVGDQNSGSMNRQLPGDLTVRLNGKASPSRWPSCAIIRADPEMVLGGAARHRRRHDRSPDVVTFVVDDGLSSVVEPLENDLNLLAFQVAVQFGESIVVTNESSASDAFNAEDAAAIAGRIVPQIERRCSTVSARAESFVVPIDDAASIIDHVDRVVRLVALR